MVRAVGPLLRSRWGRRCGTGRRRALPCGRRLTEMALAIPRVCFVSALLVLGAFSVPLGFDMTNTSCCCREGCYWVCVRGVSFSVIFASPRRAKGPRSFPRKRPAHVINAPGFFFTRAKSQPSGGRLLAILQYKAVPCMDDSTYS